MRFFTVIFFVFCLFGKELSAQTRLDYWGDTETLLQDQASLIFEEAYRMLAAYPPGANVSPERKLALYSLDAVLHDTRLDKGPAFMSYMKRVTNDVLTGLQRSKPTGKEVHVFRFYNMGFIVKTASVTVGIDLVRGGRAGSHYISDTLMRSIAEQCDILFITHRHGDHADLSVVQIFREQGKEVIVPDEFWKDMTPQPQLRVLRGAGMIREEIRLPGKNERITVHVYPGYQGDLANNVYLITLPEGKTIMHTGDQTHYEDLADKVNSSRIKVDALLAGCAAAMQVIVPGVNPSVVFTGHENEMGHTVDHREPYWLSFRRTQEINVPYILLAWGESYVLKP